MGLCLRFDADKREMSGCAPHTTNNRIELQAVIEGLNALRGPCSVTVCTDSQYVQLGVTEWLPRWKERGWRKSKSSGGGGAVANQEPWKELDKQLESHSVSRWWVKGHANDADNLRCDFWANRAARRTDFFLRNRVTVKETGPRVSPSNRARPVTLPR